MVDLIRSVVAGSALVLSAAASPPAASNPAGAAAACDGFNLTTKIGLMHVSRWLCKVRA